MYSLFMTLQQPNARDSHEPNNTKEQATPISVDGSPLDSFFSYSSDLDWVKFTIPRTGQYEIHCRAIVRNNLDSHITLYSADGVEIGSDDDGGENYDAKLVKELTPGNYFVMLKQLDSTVPGDGAYRLTVRAIQ
jgi:tyrosinase